MVAAIERITVSGNSTVGKIVVKKASPDVARVSVRMPEDVNTVVVGIPGLQGPPGPQGIPGGGVYRWRYSLSQFLTGDGTNEQTAWDAMWAGFVAQTSGASKLSVEILIDPDKNFIIDHWDVPYELLTHHIPGYPDAVRPVMGTIKISSVGYGSQGGVWDTAPSRCGTLDIRCNTSGRKGKIIAKGIGCLELCDFHIKNGGSGSNGVPFIFSTNTVVNKRRVSFRGAVSANISPFVATEAVHVYGGHSATPDTYLFTDDDRAPHQAYGVTEEDCVYEAIAEVGIFQDYANNINIVRPTVGTGCGGTRVFLINANAAGASGVGNIFDHGLFEFPHYLYFAELTTASGNVFNFPQIYDVDPLHTITYFRFRTDATNNVAMIAEVNDNVNPPFIEDTPGSNQIFSSRAGRTTQFCAPVTFQGSGSAPVYYYARTGPYAFGPIYQNGSLDQCDSVFISGTTLQTRMQLHGGNLRVPMTITALSDVLAEVQVGDSGGGRFVNLFGPAFYYSADGSIAYFGSPTSGNYFTMYLGDFSLGGLILRKQGELKLVHEANTAAPSDSWFFDSTHSVAMHKDDADVLHPLIEPGWLPSDWNTEFGAGSLLASWDRMSDFYADAAVTTAPRGATDGAYSWRDQSGNARHLISLDDMAGDIPLYRPVGGSARGPAGGGIMLRFATANKGLFVADGSFLNLTDFTMIVVFRLNSATGTIHHVCGRGGPGDNGCRIYANSEGTMIWEVKTGAGVFARGFNSVNGINVIPGVGVGGWHVAIISKDSTAGVLRDLITTATLQSTVCTGTVTSTDTAFAVGTATSAGATFAFGGDADIAAVYVLNKKMTAAQMQIAQNRVKFLHGVVR